MTDESETQTPVREMVDHSGVTTISSRAGYPGRLPRALRASWCIPLIILTFVGNAIMAQNTSTSRTTKPDVTWYGYVVVNRFPHDPAAFTQGLVWHDGFLYEGTGQLGASTLRKVKLETGKVEKQAALPPDVFGEGIAIWKGSVIQLTWQNRVAFEHDLASFERRRTFTYDGEGWGLTHDGKRLIMSNGTSTITFRDPATFRVTGSIDVVFRGRKLDKLNELEYIKGEIWANVWTTNQIVRIDPKTGNVTGIVDLTGLLSPDDQRGAVVDVLNGIAWDEKNDRIFVTGKDWPKLYEIRLVEK